MTAAHLYGLHYSPWTERARWALDHHDIEYRYHEHVPLLGEPLLRLRARRTGKARPSVPLFVDRSGSYGDSTEIVFHADRAGRGAPLAEDAEEVRRWAEVVERGLSAGRARVTANILADREALRESAMAVSPKALAGLLRPVAVQGAKFIAKKYACDLEASQTHDQRIGEVLAVIRDALRTKPYVLGDTFSAADILAATFLQDVRPVRVAHIRLPPAVRRAWTHEALADEYEDVLTWRDVLYEKHRPPVRRAA